MKIFRFLRFVPMALALGLLVCARALNAASAPSELPAAVAGTNAAPHEPEVPQSVFDITSSPVKDPFFPHTTRLPMPVATNTNVVAAIDASIFALKGLSGPMGHRLALINNRTLAVGEVAEVTVPDGRKIKIRCVEIGANTATIRAENQISPIELHYEEHFLKH